MKGFRALLKKDVWLMAAGKFFPMSLVFLILYTLYVNFGYVRFMEEPIYQVYLYDPQGTQGDASRLLHRVDSLEEMDAALLHDANAVGIDAST